MASLGDAFHGAGVSGSVDRIPASRRRRLLWPATGATILLLLVITLLGLPLRTVEAPLGVVSLQFAASPEAAERMLASWSSVPRVRLLWAHGLDLMLPVAYAVSIGLAAKGAVADSGVVRRSAMVASGSAVAAALADQVENIAMGFTILVGPSWTGVIITLVAATVKSTLLVLALAALIAASLGRRNRRTAPR